ncbi:MAG: DNA primase, partial [Nocardioidaceae bacterium]
EHGEATGPQPQGKPARRAEPERPDLGEPRFGAEREAMQVVVQHPSLAVEAFDELDDDDFTHPTLAGVRRAVEAAGGPASATSGDWVNRLRDKAEDEHVQSVLSALAVAPLRVRGEPDAKVAAAWLARPQELAMLRRIEQLKSKLQRTNPVEETTEYNRMFGQLMVLEQQCRELRERIIGGGL